MNKLQLLKLILATLPLVSFPVFADAESHLGLEYINIPKPPELPDPTESGEILEPEITIVPSDDGGTITEYRVNGNLYQVKIIPTVGLSYYLIDRDGDGKMDCRLNNIYDDICIPQWILFSW